MHYGTAGIDRLYFTDHAWWCEIVAPWWGVQMLLFGEAAIADLWPKASRALQVRIWDWAPPALRAAVTASRAPASPRAFSGPQASLF